MDGISSPLPISRPIDRLYRQQIEAGYRIGKAAVYRGHYFLPFLTSSGTVRKLLVCCLDRPTRSRGQTVFPWTRFSGDGGEITAFAVHTPTSGEPLLLGAQARTSSQVVDCSNYFSPGEEYAEDADGSVHDLDIVHRSLETGGRTTNAVRAMKTRYELRGAGAKLKAYFSTGTQKASGAKFGSAKFGQAQWGGEGGVSYTFAGEAGESDARDPARFRVNKKARFIRPRIKSSGPASVCALRDIELTTRPSGATRR